MRARWIGRAVVAIAVVAAWEAGARSGLVRPVVFASPSLIVAALFGDFAVYLHALQVTALEVLAASALSIVAGLGFGLLFGNVPFLGRVATPILSTLMAVPFIVLYPVLMGWFGPGPSSKIVYGVLVGVFPIALSTIVGVEAVDAGYLRMARAMGASRLQQVVAVTVPLALPAVTGGLRLGLSLVVAAVVLGEMLASFDGLGFWISYHRSLLNAGHVYLGILLVLLLTGLVNGAVSLLERRYGRTE